MGALNATEMGVEDAVDATFAVTVAEGLTAPSCWDPAVRLPAQEARL